MDRREFLKGSAVAAVFAGAPAILRADGAKRSFNVGLVGCGGRGNGAMENIVEAGKIVGVDIKPYAFADAFMQRAKASAEKFGVEEKFAFAGCGAYKKILEMPEVDIVILATPINFRSLHLMAAIKAGKHVFEEKGVAVDAPGVRLHIEAARLAAEKKLSIVAGTQRRHQRGYMLQAKAIAEGVAGPVIAGNVYWNSSVPWVKERAEGMSNKDYLCNNWLNWNELSGDHIVEQHVHNIDVANWFIGRYPRSALCFGMRARRHTGNQYDMFSTDFDYGDNVHVHSMCRQIDDCHGGVFEVFRTLDGAVISGGSGRIRKNGSNIELKGDFPSGNPYVIEHVDLLKSITCEGPYMNEGEQCALSTACAIMARESAYTGRLVLLDDILKNESSPVYAKACVPTASDFECEGDVPMPALGDGQFPLPGKPWRGFKK